MPAHSRPRVTTRWMMASFTLTLAAACSNTPIGPLLVLTEGGGVSVFELDGVGLDLEPVAGGVQSLQPTWSPDGRLAVWTLIDQPNSEFAIRMGDADNQRRIESPTAPFFYHWSPDAERVAFLGNAPQQQGVALGLVEVASGAASLIDGGAPYFFDWDPNGERMAIHVGAALVSYIDLEGNRTEIDVTPGQFQTPQFLPNGDLLIVQQGPPQALVSISGDGDVVSLAEVEGISMFSANSIGGRIAYTDNATGPGLGELRLYEFGGGGSVTVDPGPVIAFEWDPTGVRLLYLTIDLDAGELVPTVWEANSTTSFPGFAPSTTFLNQYLPFWDQYTRSLSLWSPPGDAFVLPVQGDRILVQHLDQAAPTEVGAGSFASWSR